jgi:flagellar biosynthesis chaperone FliJ
MTESEPEQSELKDGEVKSLIESSRRMVEQTKIFISQLENDIQRQEKALAEQRKNMNKLLDELGIEKD